MTKAKSKAEQVSIVVDSDVVRRIHQPARSQMKTEVCGVLIGNRHGDRVVIEECIAGVNATQAGTHVTFTQDTWEHVYKVKDRDFPDDRIVGWYHSHPGFGVFLSDHDTFIHQNFFSSKDQVAWVYDPHSDEEGCFGWSGSRIERLSQIAITDRRGGEEPDENPKPEPAIVDLDDEVQVQVIDSKRRAEEDVPAWLRWTSTILSHVAALCLGLFLAWNVFPRVMLIPVDPTTGRPLQYLPGPQDQPGTMRDDPRMMQQQPPPTQPARPDDSKEPNGHPQR
jgi:proteasome lid subunit RPN8/RPN11